MQLMTEQANYKILSEDFEEKKKSITIVKNKNKNLTEQLEGLHLKYEVVNPKHTDTLKKLAICDEYTVRTIIEYLDLDTYELVKNIAWTINKENSSQVISFMDWWVARNCALKEVLKKNVKRKTEYLDKMTGKKWMGTKKV